MGVYKTLKPRQAKRKTTNYKVVQKKRQKIGTFSRVPHLPSSVSKGLYGFPPTLAAKLKYVETLAFSSALGAVQSNVFRANSLFDPNETGVGHQPMYFDQFAAIYNRYVVRKARMKVTFNVVTETAATSCFTVGVIGQSNSSIDTLPTTNMEDNHSKYAIMNGRNGGTGQQVLYIDYIPERDLNISHRNTDVGAIMTLSPVTQYKFIPWVADLQATGTTNVTAVIEIVFDAEFSNLVFTPAS